MFEKGDIVYHKKFNLKGIVVVEEEYEDDSPGVDFGKGFKGHDLRGVLETKTGWWCNNLVLELSKKKTNTNNYR